MHPTAGPEAAPRPIFEVLPRLRSRVGWLPLADQVPTPLLDVAPGLWVKDDGHTSSVYGGNKARKLEFVLPRAVDRGGPVITAGATGSHHVLAVATHAARLGLTVEAIRFPQPPTDHVAEIAAAADRVGIVTDVPITSSTLLPFALVAHRIRRRAAHPTMVGPGGSSARGILGYVDAGLELARDFERRELDPPDEVVVALGSGGSAVGLGLGLRRAGWRDTTVVGVRVADPIVTNLAYLRHLEGRVRILVAWTAHEWLRPGRLTVDTRWLGDGYGHPTPAGDQATATAAAWGIEVEPTYTAKALAAALDRHRQGRRVVFVQTLAHH